MFRWARADTALRQAQGANADKLRERTPTNSESGYPLAELVEAGLEHEHELRPAAGAVDEISALILDGDPVDAAVEAAQVDGCPATIIQRRGRDLLTPVADCYLAGHLHALHLRDLHPRIHCQGLIAPDQEAIGAR